MSPDFDPDSKFWQKEIGLLSVNTSTGRVKWIGGLGNKINGTGLKKPGYDEFRQASHDAPSALEVPGWPALASVAHLVEEPEPPSRQDCGSVDAAPGFEEVESLGSLDEVIDTRHVTLGDVVDAQHIAYFLETTFLS
jgi:hypothetical protein